MFPQGTQIEHPIAATNTKKGPAFRLSLRYKLAFPVVLFVSLMLFMLFYTTFQLVRSLIVEGIEDRLTAIADVFTETLRFPFVLGNKEDLTNLMYWMSEQEDVLEVRLEDAAGKTVSSINPTLILPAFVQEAQEKGMHRIADDAFAVVSFIEEEGKKLGRVTVVFSHLGIEDELKRIFQERLLIAFVMMILLSLLTSVVTWLGIRPLFDLEKAAKRILAGDLGARASIHSYDEIEDLSGAFNEMVGRLGTSLDRLRSRTEALEESEEKYRLIVENASDIIFTLKADGEMVLLNRGFSGCNREEVLREGLSLFLLLHNEDSRREFQEALETVMRDKRAVLNVPATHNYRGSKTEIFYLVNLTPVLDLQNEVKMIQGVMRDVTELRRIDIMKESLIRDVAHELKTPAAKFEMALTWFEREMDKQNEKQKYAEILSILQNNTRRLMDTISSIMDLTKLESGVERIERTEMDLNALLGQMTAEMKPMAEKKKLKLESNLQKGALKVSADGHMLYRLFSNLIQNAIKYTESGKIVVASAREGDQAHVTIQDTGIGIEEEDLERVFDRFVQKTAASMGIGVGLTICRDITTLHSGKIWAESAGLGQGSIFHVLLPTV